ncbi:MAG: TIGR03790 family protein [Planctomycetota bacterium]|nr:MAG: TIGR03790 family protein [Planctomycetota bacterium]
MRWRSLLQIAMCAAVSCPSALALDPSGVLVLYNNASPDGQAIANHYAQTHPGVQLLGLDNVPVGEEISAADYLSKVRAPVLSALTPNTDVIVTTKGLPLRIRVDEAPPAPVPPNPLPAYVDAYGQPRTILNWQRYSSLESELAKVDFIASELMMGDQSFTIPGQFTQNSYYNSTQSFSHAVYGTRLTARLDAFSVADAVAAIDRAQNAYVVPNNASGSPFHFLIDDDPTKPYAPTVAALASGLAAAGQSNTYENTTGFLGSATDPAVANNSVLGYVGHGANQSGTPDYVPGEGSYVATSFDFTPADGAVFASWESYNAASFQPGNNVFGQALVGEWLATGGTAAVGHVEEPYASPSYVTNEDHMFEMLLNGMTLAEAAWSGTRQLSYVNTVIGDPLMTWKQIAGGDANMDGLVDMNDFLIVVDNFSTDAPDGVAGWLAGDFNGDGRIFLEDLEYWGQNRGHIADWATGELDFDAQMSPLARAMMRSVTYATPEPSTLAMAAAAAITLAGYGLQTRRKRRRIANGSGGRDNG